MVNISKEAARSGNRQRRAALAWLGYTLALALGQISMALAALVAVAGLIALIGWLVI